MNREIEKHLRLLALDQVALVCLDVFSPFFDGDDPATSSGSCAVWLNAWAATGSSPYRSHVELAGNLKALRRNERLPSRRTIGRRLQLPESPPDLDGDEETLHRVGKTTEQMTDICIELVNMSIREHRWRPGDLYVTIDGRLRPFWGLASMQRKPLAQHIQRLSSSGRLTSPAFRNKKLRIESEITRKSVPKWDGTLKGHQWLHLTLHHVKTGESFPLVTLFRVGEPKDQIRRAMEALAALQTTPLAILVDREFTHSYDVLRELRNYADPRGVYIVGPMQSGEGLIKAIQNEWDSQTAAYVAEAQETLYMACIDHTPPTRPEEAHQAVLLYTLDELRPDLEIEAPSTRVYEDPDGEYAIRGIAFYCNQAIRHEDAVWFSQLYARRWACESLFMRHVTMMGGSQSGLLEMRHFGYAGAFLLLAVYGQWRAIRRSIDKPRKKYPRAHSHATFFGILRGGLLELFLSKD